MMSDRIYCILVWIIGMFVVYLCATLFNQEVNSVLLGIIFFFVIIIADKEDEEE